MQSALNLLHEQPQKRTQTVKLKNSGTQTTVTYQRGDILQVEGQVSRPGSAGGQAASYAGGGERQAEEAFGRAGRVTGQTAFTGFEELL
jgi:hypothetical protein